MYDESILVCDEDGDEEEYELLAGRKRAGVSPVRRAPFAQQHYHRQQQRPSRSFIRQSREQLQLSQEDDDEDSLGIMSGGEESSPAPPPPQQEDGSRRKSMSTKDFAPQQQRQDSGGGKHENLISLASNFAKKMISSGSDKTKEKLPPDVAEAARRDQKGPSGPPPEVRKQPQDPQQPSSSKGHHQGHPQQPQPQQLQQQQLQKPQPPEQSRPAEEEDDDDDDEYDDVNMAQIEGLLNRVERPPSVYKGGARFIPRPPPGSPPPPVQRPRPPSSRVSMDRGAAGEPYTARQHNPTVPPQTSTMNPPQFHPGFGPATSNLMSYTRGGARGGPLSEEETSPEISISEGDVELTGMEELMDMYTGNPINDPRAMMTMPIPTPELSNLAMVDEEVMENILVHRKMWEYDLDLKREALRRRTLVMSDFPGVHSPGHEMYNPQDYEHLNVTPEIKELFHYITRYEPPIIGSQMDLKLRPFIPEYYPSVGDIDAFIKVTHPEVEDDALGIKCLDEPSPFQSDPSVLDLRLRALAKQSSSKSVVVKKIENVGKNAKVIENWIKDISDLHRSKPSPSVHYSKPMPDIDTLIQEWPPQIEDLLKTISLPSSELDCDLSTYVDIVCNLLDIPVYKSRIQSLHVLFTLYATYKHFNHYGPLGLSSAGGAGGSGGGNESVRLDDGEVDRLQIN